MATKAKTKTTDVTANECIALKTVEVPPIEVREMIVRVVGDTPLIMHKWSEKAKREMLEKQTKKAKSTGKEAKDPVADFIESLYWLERKPEEYTEEAFVKAINSGAKFGFPAVAFKAAAVSAGYRAGITTNKVSMNAAFHIMGEMVEIKGIPHMREDMVRIGGASKVADIRYRGEFPTWEAEFVIRYNSGIVTDKQIANLINMGGFACGIGEWRVEKGGSYGMYHVG